MDSTIVVGFRPERINNANSMESRTNERDVISFNISTATRVKR